MSSSWLRRITWRLLAVAAWYRRRLFGSQSQTITDRFSDGISQFTMSLETGERNFELLVTLALTATFIYLLVGWP